ncbi:MAG: carboxylesterase family protein [Thermodesulfobacteriota bacterium]|nr:carboxylesterase family protein [Thermodesulfobacteriota bacterium]
MKRLVIVLAFVIWLLPACSSDHSSFPGQPDGTAEFIEDDPCIRLTGKGYVQGIAARSDTLAWLGIPYAKPPINELRWKAPCDPDVWEGVLKTDTFCSGCYQYGGYLTYMDPDVYGRVVGKEDCLGLNIWRPASGEKGLPVFFWIHGGGNSIGEAGMGLYNGANLANRTNVVVVTVNYRLGHLGWFNHPALYCNDPLDDSGNYGTLDIIKALTWVQDNIAVFGGDPDNVTVAGQSAGAYDVYSLLLSPLAEGMFDRAIVDSGPQMTTTTVEKGQQAAQDILVGLLINDKYVDTPDKAEEFLSEKADEWIASYLRSKTVEEIYDLLTPAIGGGLGGLFPPFEDGVVIPEGGWKRFISGEYKQVPIIVGANKDEVKLFMPYIISDRDDMGLYEMVMEFDPDHPNMDRRDVCDMLDINPLLIPLYEPVSRLASDIFQVLCVDMTASLLALHQQDIYAYQFAWDDLPGPFGFFTGASHSIEIPFVFGNFDSGTDSKWRYAWSEGNRPDRQELSGAMMTYWGQFIHTGNPNHEGLPIWQQWSSGPGGSKRIVFDSDISMSSAGYDKDELMQRLEKYQPDFPILFECISGMAGR